MSTCPVAKCALCHRTAELQKSHLIPQGIYRFLNEPGHAVRNPVLVTAAKTVETSEQVRDCLLCKSCEIRFQQNGEDWVMKNGPRRNGRFPLREALTRSNNKRTLESGNLYRVPFNPAFDVKKLIYFAASVFWRSSVHHWKGFEHLMTRAKLPKGLEEDLREYLLGSRPFPSKVVLLLCVTASAPLPHITYPGPMSRHLGMPDESKGFAFLIPGLQFRLFWAFPEPLIQISSTVPPHPVLVSDIVESDVRGRVDDMRATSKVVGGLAAKLPI